ncbi:putative antigenic cell wall galactomannoprotein [Trichocladium antarcticum]|uniref:Antigenic cell wall galactomannoprotein n=1 Tax=Trichocladium antarcticum TaxID=1450529 RepID=A0AAN6ZEF0_9PEZI|nr:putative antigenic cell wall galactomannoprotein [Trichocladium antarcticum]
MRLVTLLAPLAFAASVLADGQAIAGALAKTDTATAKLGAAVSKWRGDLLGALPIVAESTGLLTTVKKGTKTAENSEPLDFDGTLAVAHATQKLTGTVNSTLTALINAKPKFDKLRMSPLIFITLELQKKATNDMSDAIIAKVPEQLQALARDIVAPIAASFEVALDVYHLF